jgi:hypothetical protein
MLPCLTPGSTTKNLGLEPSVISCEDQHDLVFARARVKPGNHYHSGN